MSHSQHGLTKKTKEYVRKRAHNKCEHCGRRDHLEVHHIVTRGRGRTWEFLNDPVNLGLLCHRCHTIVHNEAEEDYERWSRKLPPDECTICGEVWEIDSELRKISCSVCFFNWEY